MVLDHKYEITEFALQKSPSKGIEAGMFSVVETKREVVAFADTRYQAMTIKLAFERANKVKE